MSSAAIALPPGATLVPDSPSSMALPPGATLVDSGQTQPRTAMDSAKDFASELWKQVNPVSAVQGLKQLANHPIDTLKSDADARQSVYDQAEDAFKKGNYSEGAAHLLYSFIPFAGPQLNAAADNFLKGDYAKGAGSSVGMGLAMAAPDAVSGAAARVPVGELPERMYQSALKPSTTLGKDATQQIVQTGLENNIPVSAEGLGKLDTLTKNLQDAVRDEIQSGSKQGATVNPFKVTSRLSDTAEKVGKQVNPEADLAAVGDAGNEFLRNNPGPISATDAQDLKQGTYRNLKGQAYGQTRTATIEAQKALARGLKEELENQFPEIKDMNAQQGKLMNLDDALDRAVTRVNNHQLLGIGTPMAAAAGSMVTGGPVGAIGAGVMKAILDDPELKSKLAITLHKVSKTGLSVPDATARVAAYSTALGNAQPSGNQD